MTSLFSKGFVIISNGVSSLQWKVTAMDALDDGIQVDSDGWAWTDVLRKVNLTTLTLHEVWPGIIAAARSAGALAVSKNKPSVKPEAFITHLKSTISRKYNNSKMRVLHRHSTQLILPNYNPTTYILNAEKHCLLDDLQWQSSGDGDTCFSLQVWRAHSDAQMHSAWAQRVSTACAENTMYCDCS